MKQAFVITFLGVLVSMTQAKPPLSIIPEPDVIQPADGTFEMTSKTAIETREDLRGLALYLSETLSPALGFNMPILTGDPSDSNRIQLRRRTDLSPLGTEGYKLTVTPETIRIEAPQEAGLFYGMQTLRQLLPPDIFRSKAVREKPWQIPCVTIEDKPRFAWRGMHLDVCRHFMPIEFVKKYIDLLALHKMNTFHWHLTEDQGWRIEIKKYPKLTKVGAWRKETVIGHSRGDRSQWKFDGIPHGGYYTQDQIREVVEYARRRYVTIVPEIEMPGHSLAALAAYPEFSCTGGPFEVMTWWGGTPDVFCPGNEQVFEFLQDVLDEVLNLFPGTYIHIGGDECRKDRWHHCPKCQARMKAEGLTDEKELQSYFIKRMEKVLNGKGRRLVGWDEILEGGLAPNATVMSWRGEAGGIEAAQSGHDVVMAPNSHTYFDYYQANPKKEPLAIGGFIPLKRVYSYNPIPDVLSEKQRKHVLGVQGQIWTEYISDEKQVEYMAYPRACALAETAWTPPAKNDFTDFYHRLTVHLQRLKAMDVNFRPLDPLPTILEQ